MSTAANQWLREERKPEDASRSHVCAVHVPEPEAHLYGPAVTAITQFEGRWYAENGEYATEISYCPFCGVKLSAPARSGTAHE